MADLLWSPTPERIAAANMTRFIAFVNERQRLGIADYAQLYQWSVETIPEFWAAAWDFLQIKASRPGDAVVDDLAKFPGAVWFPGAKLNMAENLLRFRDGRVALVFKGETGEPVRLTYMELYRLVARLARALRALGVRPGDRVAGYVPNVIEAAAAMLATTAVGAVWSSCATDIGPAAAADRLGQIEPKLLFAADGYLYKGKVFDSLKNAAELAGYMPSVERIVVSHYAGDPQGHAAIPGAIGWEEFLGEDDDPDLVFEQVDFSHPAVVMFSSGTTGKPKCLVQSGGGILLNHLKELVLHADLERDDTLFYVTTASWMMWNWMLAGLGAGASIVLYDGNPAYPDNGALWQVVQDLQVTVFGTSASYLNLMRSAGMEPGRDYDLSELKEICQTGSALSPEGFAYVYESVKKDLHFNSISGGTDINGCFAIGNPTLPVYAGELQARGLGMKVECYDEQGRPIRDHVGELVCEAPAPSMPLYFWDDPDGRRYREAYFEVYPGVWRHGDYVMIDSETGGVQFFGRSDAVLKPSGVRIGTAEIYNVVERLPEVADSLAIGQEWQGDQRVVLFVKLVAGAVLDETLRTKIALALRENASPRHVPARILPVADIPYTLNLKKVETAVTNLLHGRPVTNRDALANPESLDEYEKLVAELNRE